MLEVVLWGAAAAAAVAVLEGVVTRGFRRPASKAPSEVQMLGTALSFASVAAGVGAAIAVGELFGGIAVWPAAGAAAAATYVLGEGVETLIAEAIQRWRGEPEAGEEERE